MGRCVYVIYVNIPIYPCPIIQINIHAMKSKVSSIHISLPIFIYLHQIKTGFFLSFGKYEYLHFIERLRYM